MASLIEHVRFEGRRPVMAATARSFVPKITPSPLVRLRRPPTIELDGDQRALLQAILRRGGLEPASFRVAPLERRLPAVLRTLRVADACAARALVESCSESAERALGALVIGHTAAFRDEHVFAALQRSILAELGPQPRIWSVGCSRGLELLSVALLLADVGVEPWQLRASDCRAIDAANDPALARDLATLLPPPFARLATRATSQWVEAQVRTIEWRREDVLSATAGGAWDLILCRNLSIYLEPNAADHLWQKLTTALRPGGFLVTGKAERPLTAGLMRVGPCTFQRIRTSTEGEDDA